MIHPSQRLAILVDTADLYHSTRHRLTGRVDYRQLLTRITAGRPLVRVIAFAVRNEDVDITPFIDALRGAGFETRVKVRRRRADGGVDGDAAIAITLAAATLVDRVDTIAIASGNPELLEVFHWLSASGVRTEIYSVEGTPGYLLRAAHYAQQIEQSWMLR